MVLLFWCLSKSVFSSFQLPLQMIFFREILKKRKLKPFSKSEFAVFKHIYLYILQRSCGTGSCTIVLLGTGSCTIEQLWNRIMYYSAALEPDPVLQCCLEPDHVLQRISGTGSCTIEQLQNQIMYYSAALEPDPVLQRSSGTGSCTIAQLQNRIVYYSAALEPDPVL